MCIQILIYTNWRYLCSKLGMRGGAICRDTALQGGRSPFRFPMGSFGYFFNLILPAALLPLDRLSL